MRQARDAAFGAVSARRTVPAGACPQAAAPFGTSGLHWCKRKRRALGATAARVAAGERSHRMGRHGVQGGRLRRRPSIPVHECARAWLGHSRAMSRAIVCVWLQGLDLLMMLLLVWQRQPPTVAAAGVHGSELGTALVSLPSGLIGALIGGQLASGRACYAFNGEHGVMRVHSACASASRYDPAGHEPRLRRPHPSFSSGNNVPSMVARSLLCHCCHSAETLDDTPKFHQYPALGAV